MSDPIVGTVANIATGLLGQKGANDRNEQQIAMTREQMAWQERMSNTAHQREVADLSAATAATINAIRTAFQVQKLLERDARGGTRYTEIIRSLKN